MVSGKAKNTKETSEIYIRLFIFLLLRMRICQSYEPTFTPLVHIRYTPEESSKLYILSVLMFSEAYHVLYYSP